MESDFVRAVPICAQAKKEEEDALRAKEEKERRRIRMEEDRIRRALEAEAQRAQEAMEAERKRRQREGDRLKREMREQQIQASPAPLVLLRLAGVESPQVVSASSWIR